MATDVHTQEFQSLQVRVTQRDLNAASRRVCSAIYPQQGGYHIWFVETSKINTFMTMP